MLLNLDLAGADFVTVAYLCRDPAMLEVVKSGRSPHPVTGKRICGVSEEVINAEDEILGLMREPERIAAIRRERFPELAKATFLPRTMSIRQMAKKAGHGLNFREGYKVFALLNEMEEREAKKVVELYSGHAYPGIQKWWDATDEQIRKHRTLTNCFGRKVYFMGALDNDTFKQAYSFIPQSTTADCCSTGMVRMQEDASPDFVLAQLLAQVHDSLLTQHVSRDWRSMARFCLKLAEYMSPTLSYHGEDYRLNVDLKAGLNWAGLKKIKLTGDEGKLALALEEAYDACQTKKAA